LENYLWFTAQNVEPKIPTMPRIAPNAALHCTPRKKQDENDTKMSAGEGGKLVSHTGEWNMSASASQEEAQL
jgi:hypothetical protein